MNTYDWMHLYNAALLALRMAGEPIPPYLASLSSKELMEVIETWGNGEMTEIGESL